MMKHFGNCTPGEFMAQAVRLRAPLAEWVEAVGIPELRSRAAEETPDPQRANRDMGTILEAALTRAPALTRRVLALATFTEEDALEAHSMAEYLNAVREMLSSDEVRGFFMYYLSAPPTNS